MMAKKTVTSSMEFLHNPNPQKMNDNIFVVLEEYLHSPSQKLAARIKELSHDLTNSAYEEAKRKFPHKYQKDRKNNPILDSDGNKILAIGADEYAPLLWDRIEVLAQEAMRYSIRMIPNKTYDARAPRNDRPYIFRISCSQQIAIQRLITELLTQKGKNHLHPEGLIFAFDTYIERVPTHPMKWLEGIEATAYDYNVSLYLKDKELIEREEYGAANIVSDRCARIKELLNSSPEREQYHAIKEILINLQADPLIQNHRGMLKTLLANSIVLASGVGSLYLAATMDKRGTFFYRPKTDTENEGHEFERFINENFPEFK